MGCQPPRTPADPPFSPTFDPPSTHLTPGQGLDAGCPMRRGLQTPRDPQDSLAHPPAERFPDLSGFVFDEEERSMSGHDPHGYSSSGNLWIMALIDRARGRLPVAATWVFETRRSEGMGLILQVLGAILLLIILAVVVFVLTIRAKFRQLFRDLQRRAQDAAS